MHKCQQYIKFLLKSTKRFKIFGDSFPDQITICSNVFFTMLILMLLVLPTESVHKSQMLDLFHKKKVGIANFSDEKQDSEGNYTFCCVLKHERIKRIMECNCSKVFIKQLPTLSLNRNGNNTYVIWMYFNFETQTFETAFNQKLEEYPNPVIHCQNIYWYLYVHKRIASYLHNCKSILRLLPKFQSIEFFYPHRKNQYVESLNNFKVQTFSPKFHHERSKRSKRHNVIKKPTESTKIFQNEKQGKWATTSM